MMQSFSSLLTAMQSSAIAPALADHLWQSTLFAAAAGLMTLTLQKNHARARYWLWLAASVKFLIPFSWLISMGRRMAWIHPVAVATDSGLYVTVEQVSQPFTQRGIAAVSAAPVVAASLAHWLPLALAAAWFAGCIAVLLAWCVRWRQVSKQIREAVPLREGREIEALRRMQPRTGIRQQIEMLLSGTTLEPGIFGMSRPVLVWPKGISEHLENAHLEAIVAHELWHVRRRDNLAAAVHMMVEAIFWFHPLVWWLGARLVDERERACDEEVLELGSERHVYAESILKVCEFCVGSPLACVAGVTGADLKKRMVHIMSEHVVRKINFSKKLLLTAVAVAAIAAPIVFGLMHATPVQARAASDDVAAGANTYTSVSIKPSAPFEDNGRNMKHAVRMMHMPDGFRADGVTLRAIIEEAYGVQANQIKGGPDWLDSARYDIDARAGKSQATPGFQKPNSADAVIVPDDHRAADNRRMLQTLLADRASLVLHRESMNLPTYALTVGDGGSKLRPTEGSGSTVDVQGDGVKTRDEEMEMKLDAEGREQKKDLGTIMKDRRVIMKMGDGPETSISAQGLSADDICQQLSRLLGAPVTNQTALKGRYDFDLQWPRGAGESPAGQDGAPSLSDPSALLNAVQEQLGLKVTPQNLPATVLVIDRIEKPAEN